MEQEAILTEEPKIKMSFSKANLSESNSTDNIKFQIRPTELQLHPAKK